MVKAAAISRTLKTQFKKSENGSTKIRGLRHYTAGFEVMQSGDKALVRYQSSSSRWHEEVDRDSIMDSYATLLSEKGYTVSATTYWGSPAILVSKEN